MYPGSGAFTGAGSASHSPMIGGDEDNGITLNFVNTDVKDVAKAVLGDYLKLNYEIGANVQGVVTIQIDVRGTKSISKLAARLSEIDGVVSVQAGEASSTSE